MHLILPPGPAMRDGALDGLKSCSGAWKRGQDNHVRMFSLCNEFNFYKIEKSLNGDMNKRSLSNLTPDHHYD